MSGPQVEVTPRPTRGVPVMLDGVEYRLRYSLRTVRKIREELGATVLEKGVTGADIGKMLWYGLVPGHPNLTLDDVEDAVDLEHLPELTEALGKAMGAEKKQDEPDPRTPTLVEEEPPEEVGTEATEEVPPEIPETETPEQPTS